METIKLIIDNKEVEVPRGTTILEKCRYSYPDTLLYETGGLALRE